MDLTSEAMQAHAVGFERAMADRNLFYRPDPSPRMRKPYSGYACAGRFSVGPPGPITGVKLIRFVRKDGSTFGDAGRFLCGDDGFYNFEPGEKAFLSEADVVAILHLMRELNRPWEAHLDAMFSEDKNSLPVPDL